MLSQANELCRLARETIASLTLVSGMNDEGFLGSVLLVHSANDPHGTARASAP
jgi:hypothetical protein